MFVDASAMVAVILRENERDDILERMEHAERLTSSPVAVFETMLAIGRETGDRSGALAVAQEFLDLASIHVDPIERDLLPALSEAQLRYGKGSGHPARLNLGDCFSYAMAKRSGTPLLYNGEDFALTDLG
jgi:ribonuclease VapC